MLTSQIDGRMTQAASGNGTSCNGMLLPEIVQRATQFAPASKLLEREAVLPKSVVPVEQLSEFTIKRVGVRIGEPVGSQWRIADRLGRLE